jgi:transaldolase/fructose-6-phosphate aldolase-like protein
MSGLRYDCRVLAVPDGTCTHAVAPVRPLGGRPRRDANAHQAYGRYLERFGGERWEALQNAGAVPQRTLWASTGTKDPGYSDVLYVEQLIAPGVINTMPEKTLRAFADHGNVERALDTGLTESRRVLAAAGEAGLDLAAITGELEPEGVEVLLRLLPRAARLHRIQARLARVTGAGNRWAPLTRRRPATRSLPGRSRRSSAGRPSITHALLTGGPPRGRARGRTLLAAP